MSAASKTNVCEIKRLIQKHDNFCLLMNQLCQAKVVNFIFRRISLLPGILLSLVLWIYLPRKWLLTYRRKERILFWSVSILWCQNVWSLFPSFFKRKSHISPWNFARFNFPVFGGFLGAEFLCTRKKPWKNPLNRRKKQMFLWENDWNIRRRGRFWVFLVETIKKLQFFGDIKFRGRETQLSNILNHLFETTI